jgi:hypothetical protein
MDDSAHYWFIVTFRGADSWSGLLMQSDRIAKPSFRLRPRKVTMNHIIARDIGIGAWGLGGWRSTGRAGRHQGRRYVGRCRT